MINPYVSTHNKRAAKHTLPPAEKIVEEYEQREVSNHPLFVWLRENPINMEAVWFLMANLRAGISNDFVRWLATAIDRTDDRRIASILAKQLNDELGNGELDQIHSLLLDRFMAGLDPWKPKRVLHRMLEPGHRLADRAGVLFHDREPYEGIGALMVGEIFAKKMDHCVGEEIRRQNSVDQDALRWLILHETLEVDHADDSLALASLIPKRDAVLAQLWRGATEQWNILWEFLDGVATIAMPAESSSRKSRRARPA
jgi:pyrroloquinoline quinone (PQQ) biosynthesis protein C